MSSSYCRVKLKEFTYERDHWYPTTAQHLQEALAIHGQDRRSGCHGECTVLAVRVAASVTL